MRSSLRELLFTEDKLYPPRLGNLAAWFDALDTSTMLAGNGNTITDGGQVALWGDKSGNSGVNCLVLPGVAGNFASVPDAAALDITSDLDIRVDCAAADWTPAAVYGLVSKYGYAENQRSYYFYLNTSGYLVFRLAVVGTAAAIEIASDAATGITDLDRSWVRVTYDQDSGAGQYAIAFWKSADGVTWSQIGTTKTGASIAATFAGTAPVLIGSVGSLSTNTDPFNGRIYRAIIKDGIDGTTVLDIDFSTAGKKLANGDTFVCATGQTVTLNSSGATGARIAGERDLFQGTLANRPVYLAYAGTKYGYLNGTAGNYFSTTALTAFGTGDFSVSLKIFARDISANPRVIAGNTNGFGLIVLANGTLQRTKVGVGDGTASTGTVTILTNRVVGYVRTGGVGTYYIDGVAAGTTVDTADYTIGVSAVGSSFGGSNAFTGSMIWGRVYSVALDATAMAADAAGAAQAGIVAHFNPAIYTSGTTFTASTGEVWTINGGAHIVTRTGLYFDGSNDYLKTAAFSLSQPETVYPVFEQVSWSADKYVHDGGIAHSMALIQRTSSPNLRTYSTPNYGGQVGDMPVKTAAVSRAVFNGASSTQGINRLASVAGPNVGTGAASGLTVGSSAVPNAYSNVFVMEIPIYSAAHTTATQDRMVLYAGRRHGFAV